MFAGTTSVALVAMAALAVSGCASKPPPHKWVVAYKTDHIPMQGLSARPRTVADERPVALVNFGDEAARGDERRSEMARGALIGAGATTIEAMRTLGPILPLCVFVPPLCIGVVAVGGAVGASQYAPSTVPQEDANRLAEIITGSVTNESLQRWTSMRIRTSNNSQEYPRLAVRVAAVILVPTTDGVTFRVAVHAQAFPSADQAWEPSIHYTQLPTRPLAEWLQSDGAILKSDLATAISGLANHVGPVYIPYEQRGR